LVGEVGPAGGIVIYVGSSTINQVTGISNGGIYLEAAPIGFTTATYNWCDGPNSGNTTLIGAGNASLGSGASNTAIMVSKCAAGAGNVAANYSKNGYSDWFLPSDAELSYLSSQKSAIGLSDSAVYWGSNETFAYIAASLVTLNGQVGGQNKAQETPLWPIRAFSPSDPLPGPQVAITRASFGSVSKIAFSTQPQITIQDASSNTVSSSSAVVTATVSAGGTLVGVTTATASSGVATFTNLGLDGTVGTTYTITYTAPGLNPATASVTLTSTLCDGTTFTCQVGDTGPGGGKIFYVAPETFSCGQTLTSTCKYLEAAPITGVGAWTDNTYTWSENLNAATGATATAIGTGYSNTLKMVRQVGAGTTGAGSVARNYRGGGKNDWYLPSKDELNEITLNQALLSATAGYWSSSEATATGAWDQGSNGAQGVADPGKQQTTPVRPIRAFSSNAPESAIIYVPAIAGVTAPVSGATPVTIVTAANGYTGTVSWSGSPSTFALLTTYTATITLTPISGFTLTGITPNFFTVAGATSVTNSADTGVITAVFPATYSDTATKVAITQASSGTERRVAFTTQPEITIQDASSNTVIAATSVVTASITSGSGGSFIGTNSATAISGVATFSGLGIDGTVGTTYTITYTVVGLTVATAMVTLTGTTCDGNSFICKVGDTGPGGGKIFYVAPTSFTQSSATNSMCSTNCKYLEAAPNTWSGGAEDLLTSWSTGANQLLSVTGARETAIGTGYQNSLAIVAQSGNLADTSAAVAARAYTGGGKDDWYLPSIDELDLLFVQRAIIGGFTERTNYWTSSEFSDSDARYIYFPNNNQNRIRTRAPKDDPTLYVRPVRAFGPPPAANPEPFIKALTSPKINLKDGKLVCTPGTYNAGYTLEGVIQESATVLFAPSTFIYNLLINGVVQSALAITSSSTSNFWNIPTSASGSLITCSVTVSLNGVTSTDKSSNNTSGASSALSTQTTAISAANATYTAVLSANDKVYQKALVENRAKWRTDTEKIRNDYYAERDRIRLLPSTKATRALASTALKVYITAQKKSAADYRASQPAALAAKDSANKAALAANKEAIARANAIYGTFIESIGYGLLIP
jgi:hypothetical protein